jgi:hypothetical protein
MGTSDDVRFRHRLTRLERASARWLIGRQRASEAAHALGCEHALGTEGVALLACLYLWGVTGILLVFIGVTFVFSADGHALLEGLGATVLLAALLSLGGGQVRAAQMRKERDRLLTSPTS